MYSLKVKIFISVDLQFSSVAQSCPTLCDPMNCSTPGLPVHHQLPEFTQTLIHQVRDASQPSQPPSSPSPAPIPPSIRVFSNESTLHIRWPKYWSFSFSISPSKEHPGLISFRMDWLDLLEVQGTLKSLLQHHSSKASILTILKKVGGTVLYVIRAFSSFTSHCFAKMLPYCFMSQRFIHFHCCVIFLYVTILQFIHLLSCLWAFGLLALINKVYFKIKWSANIQE